MYVPPYSAFLKVVGMSRPEVDLSEHVTIPTSLFKFLLQLAVSQYELDENIYMKANKDVRYAVHKHQIKSAILHYIGYGFFENRPGTAPEVDEAWYLQTNSDVAAAIASGKLASAAEHFAAAGAAECRAPNPALEQDVIVWRKALGLRTFE